MPPTVHPSMRRLAILALLTATVLAAVGCGRGGTRRSNPPATTSSVPTPTTTETGAETGPTTTVLQTLSPAQLQTVDQLKAQVSEIRGLPWKAEVPVRILSPKALGERIRELTLQDLDEHKDEADATEDFLKLVGLFPANLDYARPSTKCCPRAPSVTTTTRPRSCSSAPTRTPTSARRPSRRWSTSSPTPSPTSTSTSGADAGRRGRRAF